MTSNEEHYERKLKEVVEDEVTSDPGGSSDILAVGGEQAPDVADLGDEKCEPREISKSLWTSDMKAYQYNEAMRELRENGVTRYRLTPQIV